MAIKILKEGRGAPVFFGKCSYCHCEFEYKHEDAVDAHDDQREGFSYVLICPSCGRMIWCNKEVLRYE